MPKGWKPIDFFFKWRKKVERRKDEIIDCICHMCRAQYVRGIRRWKQQEYTQLFGEVKGEYTQQLRIRTYVSLAGRSSGVQTTNASRTSRKAQHHGRILRIAPVQVAVH